MPAMSQERVERPPEHGLAAKRSGIAWADLAASPETPSGRNDQGDGLDRSRVSLRSQYAFLMPLAYLLHCKRHSVLQSSAILTNM